MTMTDERLAELRAMFDAADRQNTYWLQNVLSANALTDLGAADVRAALDHIEAQAATIARLTALMMDVDGISDAIGESFDVDWSSRDGARHVVGYFETENARATIGAAS